VAATSEHGGLSRVVASALKTPRTLTVPRPETMGVSVTSTRFGAFFEGGASFQLEVELPA
jgi:hypothetical protein